MYLCIGPYDIIDTLFGNSFRLNRRVGDNGFWLFNRVVIGNGSRYRYRYFYWIPIGKKQKSWSELTDSEKKTRIAAISVGVVFLVTGIVILLIRLLT